MLDVAFKWGIHYLHSWEWKSVLNEKHKDLMRRVFGTDNLQAIIDDDTNAAGDYAVNMLIPIQMFRP